MHQQPEDEHSQYQEIRHITQAIARVLEAESSLIGAEAALYKLAAANEVLEDEIHSARLALRSLVIKINQLQAGTQPAS